MSDSILIKNARLVNEGLITESDLLVRGGRIARIDAGIDADSGTTLLDADGAFDPLQICDLLAPIETGGADLVLGSRQAGGMEPGAMPSHAKFGNWLVARLMGLLYGLQVTDLGPFRAIRADLLTRLAMREMTYGWPTEMMVKAARLDARVVEVPVCYRVRRGGRSKVSGTVRGTVLATYYILFVTLRYAVGGKGSS